MNKYVRVMDGIKSNAGGFEYKLDEINISNNWNTNEVEPEKMGGFNFGSEDKILRWLHRGDTIYDVIIPEDAEIILCNEEKGVWRANKIIVTNPQKITDEMVIELYKKTTLSNKVIAQCLQTLLWKNRIRVSKYIINDRVNKENVAEFISEFENYVKKSEKFNYDELEKDSKIIYDMLKQINVQQQITILKGAKMETKIINDIAIVKSNEIIIKDVQSAIDFIMTIKYETNCNKIALNKGAIVEDFFILSKGLAGEILQKFINYQTKFAIYGDYSKYTSKPLKDFIYESNNGKDIFFIENENEAIEMLEKA